MYKVLLVEDTESDVKSCKDSVAIMNKQNPELQIEVDKASSYEEALEKLNKDYMQYTGAIVDIKLNGENTGNAIIEEIITRYRLPVAVMTGTPDTILEEGSPIRIYKKGEKKYQDIVNDLIKAMNTGLFDVIGGKGIIESTMNQIFWKNLYPQINMWQRLKEEGYETEKILLRFAISHIQELLDYEVPKYVTQEMYIKPPITEEIKTGSVIKNKEDNLYYVVLSPPCDLAIHDGKMKTDTIMICKIEPLEDISREVIGEASTFSKRTKCLKKAITNSYTEYYHWLPQNDLFVGGYINFRHVYNYSPNELNELFEKSELHISDYFVKDILSRFSAYYARQGQPDFMFDEEAEKLVKKIFGE